MSPSEPLRGSAPARPWPPLLGTALALPTLALVAPVLDGRPPLALDPSPEASAAGWVVLAAIPALALVVLSGAAARVAALPWLLGAWLVALSGPGVTATESFGADRALLTWTAAASLVVAGGALGAGGRATFAASAALLGLALVATARALPAALGAPGIAGALGNTGDLSEAALPAGVLGLGLFLHGPRWVRPLGLTAALAHALYAGLAPVHAGTFSWAAAAFVAYVASAGRPEAKRLARLALLATFVAVAAAGARSAWRTSPVAPDEGVAPAAARDALARAELGGGPFRLATWRATAALIAAHPLGVGAGQFQAAFPPFRDRDELERSSHGRAEPTPQEVEHPHQDLLLAFAELGWLGGGLFAGFLALATARAIAALRGPDGLRAAFGLAALAGLANGLVNTPLLAGTASAAVSWPILGALLAGPDQGPSGAGPRRLARWAPALCLAALVLQAPRAASLVAHGQALSGLPEARVVVDGREELDAAALERVLARALAARPDSVVALEKRAELEAARGDDPDARRALLLRVLAARPHAFAAHLALGNLEAAALRFDAAAAAYDAASASDARHPALLANRLTLAQDRRDPAAVAAALAAARDAGAVPGPELERRIAEQLLRGRLEVADALLASWAPGDGSTASGDGVRYVATDANEAFRANKALRELGRDLLADGFLCAYQLLIAREHREGGLHEQAVRMARQALRRAEAWPGLPGGPAGPSAIRLELAAALVAAGDTTGAREALSAGPIPAVDLAQLPGTDRERLVAEGLVAIRAGVVVVPE